MDAMHTCIIYINKYTGMKPETKPFSNLNCRLKPSISRGVAGGALAACLAAAARDGDLVAGRAGDARRHGRGRRRERLDVEPSRRRRPLQLRELQPQPLVLSRQALAAALQDLAVHLRLLQLCSDERSNFCTTSSEHASGGQ